MSASVSVSLDNITICANEVNKGQLEMIVARMDAHAAVAGGYTIDKHGVLNPERVIQRTGLSKWPYRSYVLFKDGTLLQVKAKKADVKEFRLEFNPNKCDQKLVMSLLKTMTDIHLTRLDVAVDYLNVDLADYQWTDLASRKRRLYQTGAGRLETRYMGERSSDGEMVRIYNKAKEQHMPGVVWWRVESQLRFSEEDMGGDYFAKQFKDVHANLTGAASGLKLQERAMLEYLANHPEAWGELSEGSRQKYRALLTKEMAPLDPSPRQVVELNRVKLETELFRWILWSGEDHPKVRRLVYERDQPRIAMDDKDRD